MDITETLAELGLAEANHTAEEAVAAAKVSLATLRESASTVESVTAAHSSASQEIERFKGEIETVKASLTTAQTELQAFREKEAEAVKAANAELIQAAVNRGAIPSQDTAAKDFWSKSLESDPTGAKAALAALPGIAGATETVVASQAGTVAPLTREEFDALPTFERNKFIRSGGKVAK